MKSALSQQQGRALAEERGSKQAGWFKESTKIMVPTDSSEEKMLAVRTVGAKCEFKRKQQVVKKAVDKAREHKKDGRTCWNNIRGLQQANDGRSPARQNSLRKDNMELTQGPDEVGIDGISTSVGC